MPVPFLLADTSGGDGEVIEDIANGYNRMQLVGYLSGT